MYRTFFKRILDFFLALTGLIVLSPVFTMVTIALLVANSGRPFFIQKRPGKDEKIFRIIKFKTMNDKTDSEGNLLPDHHRLTKIGKWVRKLSLDEIPQLINVLKGDMSLVGPRPLRIHYLPLYSQEQRKRHKIRPGITGWAQINGRNTISWTEKFRYDVMYVDNLSFTFDLKILILTLMKVIKTKDVNTSEYISMEPFNGKN